MKQALWAMQVVHCISYSGSCTDVEEPAKVVLQIRSGKLAKLPCKMLLTIP